MELKGATLLYTLAGMMITFAGFSALLLAVRPASGAKLSMLDRFLAKTVMSHLFILTGGALTPPLLALYDVPEHTIWRAAGLVFGLPMLTFQITFPARRTKAVGERPPFPILAVFVVLGATVTLGMIAYLLLDLPHGNAVYISALTINFFPIAFAFLVALEVIIQQASESKRIDGRPH